MFSTKVRNQSSPEFAIVLDGFAEQARKFSVQFHAVWQPNLNDQRQLFNNDIDLLHAAYTAKVVELTNTLVHSVNEGTFTGYALAGRALIEHAATARYYIHRIAAKVTEYSARGRVTPGELADLHSDIDRNLRGSRFNWSAFEAGDWDALRRDVQADSRGQINVKTCVEEKWAKDEPDIAVLYGLFCDLVHPNIGSSFLVMRIWNDTQLGFGNSDGESVGWQVFVKTLPGLIPVLAELSNCLDILALLRFDQDALGSDSLSQPP